MTDTHKKPEEPNLVRFERSGWRAVFADIGKLSDNKGQSIASINSVAWNPKAVSTCLETDAKGRKHLETVEISGLSDIKDEIQGVLSKTQFALGNTLPNIKRALSVEVNTPPDQLAFPVNGITGPKGTDPNGPCSMRSVPAPR